MKAHVSRRALLPRLNICLAICCFLTLLTLRECNAYSSTSSGAAVKEVQDDIIKGSVVDASQINEGLKNVDEIEETDDKKHQRFTEAFGKLDKDGDGSKEKTVTRNFDSDTKTGETVERRFKESQGKQQQKEDQKTLKRLIKRPIRRLKRSDHDASQEKVQIAETIGKSVNDKQSEVSDYEAQNKKIDVEGIRRLDINVEEEEKKGVQNISKENTAVSKSNVDPVVEIKSNINDEIKYENRKDIDRIQENESKSNKVESHDTISKQTVIIEKSDIDNREKSENELKPDSSKYDEKKVASSRAEAFSRLEFLKTQALEFQAKIRNNTFLQSLKDTMTEILPDIPKFTENQFLEILKNITSKKNLQTDNDLNADTFKDSGLSDKQIQILKCAQQLVAQKERQSFFDNMTECIRGLNVMNCMRAFIYPIIVENMPEALSQAFSNFPIEINVSDIFQGNRDKSKTGRQVPFYNYYMKQIDPDAIIFELLKDGLSKLSSNENLPSFIAAKNESFSRFLSCNRLQLLQLTEKFLPENERQQYSDEMLSCVRRFEYFSCIKYFSWPAMRKYYSTLPQFPLSDSFLMSLTYSNNPLITYPGYETGFSHLPEIIDSGPARMKPETIILHIFRKALNDYSRIPTQPTPIQLDLFYKNQIINPEQMMTIHLAEQLLPIHLRTEYISKISQCIRRFDYYNCMKYVTWPSVRQSNPTIPSFQDIINNFQFPEIPGLSNFFELFSQFQLPQFPSFQLPEIPNFSFPDFSSFIPSLGQQSSTTSKPAVDSPADAVPDSKENDSAIESRIYKILKNVRDSMGATPLSHPTYTNRKIFLFPLMTEEQSKIFALAESIVPPLDREPLITSMYFCLNDKNLFLTCTKTIIWPSLRNYIKGLPEFPTEDTYALMRQKIGPYVSTEPYTMPIGSGDNFFIMREIEKFFIEGREDAMKYILRSIQTSSPNSLNMRRLLEILRSIQFNTPEFLNAQMIQYPSIPDFAYIATGNQKNIIHTVETIIPLENRQKFQNDMIDCLQKNKFPICSRNIIFPAIYRYFQNALSIPYNMMQEKKTISKISGIDAGRVQPMHVDAKFNAFKPEADAITAPKKCFSSSSPLNPEIIIIGMIKKIQITAPSLPKLPKETISNTNEFKSAFNIRQAHILTTAEAILPEEYRKGFLDTIFKCNQKDSFLNCTRDIMFPLMKKAYIDFPDFPNIENDLNRSKMLQVIDSLNNTSPRSYHNKRTLPSIEILYKFVPQDKTDKLRVLIDKLPDSLYYSLYSRMAQCVYYFNIMSCGRDNIYPVLNYYYDAPGFDINDYYPLEINDFSPLDRISREEFDSLCAGQELICPYIGNFEISRKQDIVIKPERSLISLYPLNPELIILSMVRKVHISSTSLPRSSKESIANTVEFRKAFDLRQAHILVTAESILPKEYRKEFLDSMFKCNQKDSFLNCSRDIMFPLIKKVYLDFPDFPNIENDLNRSKMLQVLDNLNNSPSRPIDPKKILPSTDMLFKFAPQDKTNKLRVLIDKLPDSLYYSLYSRMAQCVQYLDIMSCGRDNIYPVLKYYYDAPGFNVNEYYPLEINYFSPIDNISRQEFDALCAGQELICPYIGNLGMDRKQDIWNLNFTPSVGTDNTFRSSADESPDSFLNFSEKTILFSNSQRVQNPDINFSKRTKRNVDDLLDSYPDAIPVNKKNSVPRRIPPKLSFPNITETELLQILVHINKLKSEPTLGNEDIISSDYFVDSLNDTERALITADQYEILKLVQGLNSETAKAGFMRKMFQCIRSLSFLRCVGIFVWPMIVSNLPSLPFNFAANRDSRAFEEMQIKEMFGVSSTEFETELISRKEQIEYNFVNWYKELTENKFEKYIGPLKIIGHGDGELAIKFAGHREGRLSKIKDNKSLPSILTIISDVVEEVFEAKSNKTKNKKDNSKHDKKGRSLLGFEESYDLNENEKRSVKDDQVVNMLLERLRPTVPDTEDEDMKHYFSLEDAYRAFQVLFGPKISSRIANQLKSFNAEHYKHFEKNTDDLKSVEELHIVPLKVHEKSSNEKFKIFSSRDGRLMSEFNDEINKSNILKENLSSSERLTKFKSYVAEYLKKFLNLNKKNIQTGLTVRLPRLNDNIEGRKMTSSLTSIGRDIKKKMTSVMPAAGIAATFVVHLALAHLKAAATVSNLLSNMALGSAMFGMVRDMILGSNNQHPKVKYVYTDTEKYDSGISWPPASSDPITRYTSPYT